MKDDTEDWHPRRRNITGAGIAVLGGSLAGVGLAHFIDPVPWVVGVSAVLVLVGAVMNLLAAGRTPGRWNDADFWSRVVTVTGAFIAAIGAVSGLVQDGRDMLFAAALWLLVLATWLAAMNYQGRREG